MSDSDTESVTVEISKDDFKNAVQEYIVIFDKLSEVRKQTAELNKRKKKISEFIMAFMKKHEKSFCNLGENGTIEMKTTKTKQALKKDDLERLLLEYGNNQEQSKEIAEFLINNKRIVERNSIKRSLRPID